MKKTTFSASVLALLAAFVFTTSCKNGVMSKDSAKLSVAYEKYELENGLDVILHQDKSDPIVSLAVQYGVGSNREKTGRTGFAHLFEHMLFQESENVPQDQFFKKIQDAGGKAVIFDKDYGFDIHYVQLTSSPPGRACLAIIGCI